MHKNEAEFISQCVTDGAYQVGVLFTDDKDRERYIKDRYQTYLKYHEKKERETSEGKSKEASEGGELTDGAEVSENKELTDDVDATRRRLQDEEEYGEDDYAYEEGEYDEFEEEEEDPNEYFKFKTWKEYCDRRFKNAEENTYCRVVTDSIEPESIDHCGKKHFSTPKTKYFEFDKIWYYYCIANRNKGVQAFDEDLKKSIDECYGKLTSGEPIVNVVLCY